MGVENGIVMDDGAFRAISLIGEGESGCIGREEERRARVEWKDFAFLSKFHVSYAKLMGASLGSGFNLNVFADS